MNLHEYQAKKLFSEYGIPVPVSKIADSAAQAGVVATQMGGKRWVVKAQAHTGGRGKGGGVKIVDDIDAVQKAATGMLGKSLVTHQTGAEGLPVHRVLIEQPTSIRRELYLGILIDRATENIVIMASSEGGMDIEAVAADTPEKIVTTHIDPAAGLQSYQCRYLGFALGLQGAQLKQFSSILYKLAALFENSDASLIEINPLVVTESGTLMALDAKINLDDNGLFRHAELEALRDVSQEDKREAEAREFELNYISLEGEIGCMVNGAGLAMATMDLVKLHGGRPANFLDVGGGTTAERVAEAFKLILSDDQVAAILVNIFGGIVRCDLIAEGIIAAAKETSISIPLVVRLEGTNAAAGLKMLEESGLQLETATDLTDAAQKVVAAAGGAK